ncbi:CLUMA_CG002469, isoform A [Clunio marinus]|uniref:CLUMA_CG002469, isoform A n=1 Tax=Clunio marinus TaxID=568069 RepID=A0A1J1HKZ3_9DIPT|nr:CLUMA_CG002469, isoform A [Clunio marinus]
MRCYLGFPHSETKQATLINRCFIKHFIKRWTFGTPSSSLQLRRLAEGAENNTTKNPDMG